MAAEFIRQAARIPLAAVGADRAHPKPGDRAVVIDVAAEAELARAIAAAGIAAIIAAISVIAATAGAQHARYAQPARAAFDVADRGHPERAIPLAVALAVVAVALVVAVVAAAVLALRLGHGRPRALPHRLPIGDIVAVAEQLIDDVGDRVAGVALA